MTRDQFAIMLQQMVNKGKISYEHRQHLLEDANPRLKWFGVDDRGAYGYFAAPTGTR